MPVTSAQIDAIPGVIFRVRATDIAGNDGDHPTGFTVGGSLAKTLTKSGNPTLKRNIVNGKSVLRFNSGTGDFYTISGGGLTLGPEYTIFIVHQTSGDCMFMAHSSVNVQIRIGIAGANKLAIYDAQQYESATLATARGTWNIVEYRCKNQGCKFVENGTGRGMGAMTNATDTFDEIMGFLGGALGNGDIAEIIIVNRRIITLEEANVYDYAKNEYALATPAIVPTNLSHARPTTPTIYNYIGEQANGQGVNWSRLPIRPVSEFHLFNNNQVDTTAHFDAAIAAKWPNANATGHAQLDLEVASPALLPPTAALYAGAAWLTTDRDYIINSLLERGRTARPNLKWGVYQQPYFTSVDLNAGVFSGESSMSDWMDAWCTSTGLQLLLQHVDVIAPEVYPYNEPETQAQSDFVAASNVQLARDMNDYYVGGTPSAKLCGVWTWVQETAGPGMGTLLSRAVLTRRLLAVRRAGADVIYLGGDASLYTTAQWQAWADGDLTQALGAAGFSWQGARFGRASGHARVQRVG